MKPDPHKILAERLVSVRERIANACRRARRSVDGVNLVAVTKTVPPSIAAIAVELGVLELGENRPQELWKKAEAVPAAHWHLIGHLQRNKIDRTVPLVSLIHAVDSERLLDALDASGRKRGLPVPMLLEVNCSREESKGGFAPEAVPSLSNKLMSLGGISVRGLMTMAAYADDPEAARPTFVELRHLRDKLATRSGLALPHLSMGMSGDFEVAVEEGATFVRIGTILFDGLGEVES
ncbi:MAG TPA: YggS family pyridoxal phosphate-dependent enzyme [Gemmata sp.]|jgi:pyridoxal phosphate enzyme (YggS family)|nr:YggS family pyridoxal phosphate-dependent enzyme [Gemmata sp.]